LLETRLTKFLLAAALALGASAAAAQPAVAPLSDCLLRGVYMHFTMASEPVPLVVERTYGKAYVWWIPLPPRTGDLQNKTYWQPCIWPVHADDEDKTKFAAAVARVAAVTAIGKDPKATIDQELAAAKVLLEPGSLKQFHYKSLFFGGCMALQARPAWPKDVTFDPKPADYPADKRWVTDPDWCGPEPVPPVITTPPGVYLATSTAAYPLNADGTRSITRWPQPAVIGETCDASVSVVSFGVRFYRIPRLSTTQTVVAGCAVKK
jgi:hypothetical protein